MNVKENNLDKVMDYIHEKGHWDNIDFREGKDKDDNTFFIFDTSEDINAFNKIVKKVLDIKDDNFWLDDILGIEIVYSDSYTTCEDCGNVIRTEPDSYHWQPDYFVGDGYIVCNACFNDNTDYQKEYVEEKINNPKNAINGLLTEEQIEGLGFTKLDNEYENGWYHVEDSPEEIYDRLKNHYDEVLFYINNVEQFRINFVVFVRGEI